MIANKAYVTKYLSAIVVFYLAFCPYFLFARISASTFVRLDNTYLQSIATVCDRARHDKVSVLTYNSDHNYLISHSVINSGCSQTTCCVRLGFDLDFNELSHDDIVCTPYQQFYVPERAGWIAAHQLHVGDELFSYKGHLHAISYIQLIHKNISVYSINVEHTHTFFVGRYSVLTHNMELVEANLTAGMVSLPITMASSGICFGPVGAAIAGAVTAVVSALIHACVKSAMRRYTVPIFDISPQLPLLYGAENNDAQVTGKPTEKDKEVSEKKEHPHGRYEDAPYHHNKSHGTKSAAPKNGQKALDNSVPISENSTGRIGVAEGEIVILRYTSPQLYHGHVGIYEELEKSKQGQKIINILEKNKFINKKGKILE